ncbi:lysophospholipid acyltransferase family protein [Bermanella sp. R86510]|uniref:lysophospholipid acyltransferase family protein n=1 Tax=unclassified Bermanella TaxID=2627862 RepID=UPI0037C5F2EC
MHIIRIPLLAFHFLIASFVGLAIGILRPFHPTNSRLCAKVYGIPGLAIIGLKRKTYNLEAIDQNRPCIIVANHQSNWDLFVLGSTVPKRTVSLGKKSLKWVPLFGQLYWLAGNVMIDRGNNKRAMAAMDTTRDALINKNTSIWIFPEGTRNRGKNMLPFKKGAFVTAINAGVPIVPVVCSAYLEHFSLGKFDNGTAHVKALDPISTEGLTVKDAAKLMDTCHQAMSQEIHALNQLAR